MIASSFFTSAAMPMAPNILSRTDELAASNDVTMLPEMVDCVNH